MSQDEPEPKRRPLIRLCIEIGEDRDERIQDVTVHLTTRAERWPPFERHDAADDNDRVE